ncbi:MAG: response regulator, partial [Planctomycetes bacterium]|nr:response regulator [Planctomycetota bacterium]
MDSSGEPSLGGEVLIVEDTLPSLTLLSELMQGAGYVVRQAQDGEMALLTVRSKLPDLILLDVRMPGIDGFEVCRRLKADPATAGVPVIFLSALQDVEAKVNGFRVGAVDYVTKPYQPEEVMSRVRTHLELRNLQLRLGQMCELRTQQLQQEVAERRNVELELRESRQKLRELTGHLEDVREEERARIAREIHDELGQSLTVARIDLTRLGARLDEPREKSRKYVEQIIAVLDQAADMARSISENLRPGMLDLLGLGPAIEHHVVRFKEMTGLNCSLEMDDLGGFDVDDRVATAAFRILQEALTNVARHAKAKNVEIHVVDLGTELVVIVQDDGVGMATKATGGKTGRYGLLGMSERAQLLGGSLVI